MNAKITMVRSLGFDSPHDRLRLRRLLESPTAGKLNRWLRRPSLQTANSRSNPSSLLVTPASAQIKLPNGPKGLQKDISMPKALNTPTGPIKKNQTQKKDPSNQLYLGPPHSRDLASQDRPTRD
jgi:hypothetical protein